MVRLFAIKRYKGPFKYLVMPPGGKQIQFIGVIWGRGKQKISYDRFSVILKKLKFLIVLLNRFLWQILTIKLFLIIFLCDA